MRNSKLAKRGRSIGAVGCMLLLLSGCGGSPGTEDVESKQTADGQGVLENELFKEWSTAKSEYEAAYLDQPVRELMRGNWKREELKNADSFMTFSEYIEDVFPVHESSEFMTFHRGYSADEQAIYSLECYYVRDEEDQYFPVHYLNRLDGVDKTVSFTKYTENYYSLDCFYTAGGRFFAVSDTMDEDGIMNGYQVVELKENGQISPLTDVIQVVEENGWLPLPHFGTDTSLWYEPATENSYVLSPGGDKMVVTNREGEVILVFPGFGEEGNYKVSFLAAGKEGHLLFTCTEGNQETIFYLENEKPTILYSGEKGSESSCSCGMIDSHGNLAFLNYFGAIVGWDTESGTQERLYVHVSAESYRYSYDPSVESLMRNEKGELLVLADNHLMVFTATGPAQVVEIDVKPLTYMSYNLKQSMRRYEQTHPGVKFKIQADTEWSEREKVLGLTLTDIAENKGPDLLIVTDDQLVNLEKNDCLMNLDGVIQDEIKGQLVPGVLKAGIIGDGLYELPVDPNVRTMIVNKKYCDRDTWTISDILDIIEEREKEGNPFEQLIVGGYFDQNPFYWFMLNIGESEFMDLENKSCNFDSDAFIRFLEVCGRYDPSMNPGSSVANMDTVNSESLQLMKNDKALIYMDPMLSLSTYSSAFSTLGEAYHTIGYPTTKKKGSKILFSQGVAVNRISVEQDAYKREVIEDFLNCMYLPNYMIESISSTPPLRLDAFEGRIGLPSESSWSDTPYIRLDSHSVMPISGKPDGSSYVEEYVDLLKTLEPMGLSELNDSSIMKILSEEADYYFNHSKSAEEVAQTIQSRVQLFLMEQQ